MKTKLFLSIFFLLVSSIFADTIYLRNGQEVKDAVVTEIGVSDVKYKIGKKQVVYTVRKVDIAIIFYDDGSKEVFEADKVGEHNAAGVGGQTQGMQNIQNTVIVGGATVPAVTTATVDQNRYENFSTGQRWGTWALNALTISGLGSWLIMSDVVGGFVHLGLDVAAVAALLGSESETCDDLYSYGGYYSGYNTYSSCYAEYDYTWFTVLYITGAVWNIYRSASYDKPKNVAYSKYGYINMAILPDKHGNFMPAVRYNKPF